MKKYWAKERDTGPRGGDRQPSHEGGRGGQGTRGGGSSGGKGKGTTPKGKGK